MGKKAERRALIAAEEQADASGQITRLSETRAQKNPDRAQADLIDLQRRDFETRFRPLEDRLRATIQESPDAEARRAGESATKAGAISRGAFLRDLSRSGTKLNARQTEVIERNRGLSEAKAVANAKNQSRSTTRDTNLEAQAALIGIGRGVQQGANQDLAAAAGLQAGRESANRAADSAQKAQNTQTLATVAGIAAAVFL